MKRILSSSRWWPLAALAAIAFFPACAERSLRKEYLQACECGKPEHDVLGCTAGCRAGNVECQNPLCTCESSH